MRPRPPASPAATRRRGARGRPSTTRTRCLRTIPRRSWRPPSGWQRCSSAPGAPFALAGSVAAFAHGLPATFQHDTDFCVRPEDAEEAVKALEGGGIAMRRAPEDWLVKGSSGGEEIDLIFELARRPVSTALLQRATVRAVDSVWMPVLSPTDLMDSRLAALCEHYCDFGDLLPMARMLREQIDWDRLDRDHRDSPLADAFLHLLATLRVIDRTDVNGRPERKENGP
ncbi:hypothetical protein AB0F18_35195 [Streptomyces sp. NPDC029216]|uniref:nucleotidyltransferase family protein n=1 Tax=Streptomyces sp. NPDC029216 TaxID=3154701 RepID=UPI0033F93CAC